MQHTNKKCCITGVAGYVGLRLANSLIKRGYQVSGLDVCPRPAALHSDVKYVTGDLTMNGDWESVLAGSDVVIHLAASIGAIGYMHEKQADILRNNARIDSIIYDAVRRSDAKHILYSSSSMVYENASRYPYTEADLPRIPPPTNVYGFSKLIGEYFCRAYASQYGTPFTILRFHNIYGPEEEAKGEGYENIHVIPALIKKVLNGQYPLQIIGDPLSTRPFTYVDDAVEAAALIIDLIFSGNKEVINEDFNVSAPTAMTILDLAKLVWEKMGDSRSFEYQVVPTNSGTAIRREPDVAKLQRVTGWSPTVNISDGITKVIDSLKNA